MGRKSAPTRGRRKTPRWLAMLPLVLATLFLLFVLYRVGSGSASPVLARQGEASSPVEALPASPEAVPAAPGALAAPAPRLQPVRVEPPALAAPKVPELPDAPSMLTAPQAPQVTSAPVVQAPVLPAPPPAPAPPAPSVMAAPVPEPVSEPAPAVVSAPVRPEPAPGVTNTQGWKETPIRQERPVVRIYNTAGDSGRSMVFLTNGRLRYRVQIRNPYGEVTLPPGNYRYALYVFGSAAAPAPDQVGILRCRKYTQYSLDYFLAPFTHTRREDLGDETSDGP